MNAYLALTQNELRLAFRDKQVLFFNYAFPLIFFFLLSAMLHAERGGSVISVIVTNVLVIGILGNGFFGAGIRAVQEREQNILHRFKVAPISPLPILGASLTTGLLLFIPAILLTVGLARALYGMPIPDRPISLILFLAIGALAFRSIGLIVAAVSNSMAESHVLVQLLYMPMMFLSGAAIPALLLPRSTQTVAQFMPAAYLVSGMQGILTQHESLYVNWQSAAALVLTLALSIFVAMRLFRWEKDEKLKGSAKLWVAGVMVPFIALGVYQFRTDEQTIKNRVLWRQLQRGDAFLIRNARVFVGDGRVMDNGSVLVRKGRIEGVYEGAGPDAAGLKAEVVEASGKTIMPGLIDVHVHLGAPGGIYADARDVAAEHIAERALAQYLYSGVTTVRSTGDTLDGSIALRKRTADGDLLGAERVVSGPLFTTEGGHGTEYFSWLDGPAKAAALDQFVRTPASPDQARTQVRELKAAGVDAIKAVLESGRTGMLFARMDLAMFRAVVEEANTQRLPASVHTGGARDVEDAVDAGASSVEHGSFSDAIPAAVLARMAAAGIAYDPTLAVLEGMRDLSAGRTDLLRRSLCRNDVRITRTAATTPDGVKAQRRFSGLTKGSPREMPSLPHPRAFTHQLLRG